MGQEAQGWHFDSWRPVMNGINGIAANYILRQLKMHKKRET